MNPAREQLIAALSADLRPVHRHAGGSTSLALWSLGSAFISTALELFDGPFRAGFAEQLLHSPRFLAELLLGSAAIGSLGLAGLRLAIPDIRPLRARVGWPLWVLAAWRALMAYGLHVPSLPFSMEGKRPLCPFESAPFGMPGLVWGLWIARRWWPLHDAWSGLLLGLASGAMPALLMHLACMVSPAHVLLYHLLQGLSFGAVGALAGAVLLRAR